MDTKKYIKLCYDMFFCGAGAASFLKKMILSGASGADVFSFFENHLAILNESYEVIDKAELLKALKELEPEMREHIQKANTENIKELNEKLN